MKNNSTDSGNKNLLQQFAVKSKNKSKIYGDRAVTWNRSSSEKQDYQWQVTVTSGFVQRNNWALIKAFGVKESAKTNDGEEFQEMLNYCYREKISHIVFFSYDRFNRSGDISILKKLRADGIKVHGATQVVDDETPSGRFSQQMYMIFAEMENEQRREKIIEGIKNKLRKGEWPTTTPVGYEKRFVTGEQEHPLDKPQCFIDKKGELIRQAFIWKDKENLSHVEILSRLRTMGLKMKMYHLTRIFRNIFYIGYITHSLLDEGEIIKGKHEPLIDEATFYRVNGIVDKMPHGWKNEKHESQMPLKGTILCGVCDRPLTAYLRKEKYIYYKCPNKGCCVNVSSINLHQLFHESLSELEIEKALFSALSAQLESMYSMLHKSETVRLKPMKDEHTRLKNELETMELNLATGKLPLELYKKHSSSHQVKIDEIQQALLSIERDSSNLTSYINNTLEFAGNLVKMWQNLDWNGKVRLQKLVFPEGIYYMPEKGTLRTIRVNPIFSVITSISQHLTSENNGAQASKPQELHQVYLAFGSSNFFWDNLEKIANLLASPNQIFSPQSENISITCELPIFYSEQTTNTKKVIPVLSQNESTVGTLFNQGIPTIRRIEKR